MFKKLKGWILPKEIDFFASLNRQCAATYSIVNELNDFYFKSTTDNPEAIFRLINEAKKLRLDNIQELNSAFITPVDKEAISRAYTSLHWIALSVKHLVVEMNTYQIKSLGEYEGMIELLLKGMTELNVGFELLKDKKYDDILYQVNRVIHYDDHVIKEYAKYLEQLFKQTNTTQIFQHREVLSQLKEISKRIHHCGNILEDIVFKMN